MKAAVFSDYINTVKNITARHDPFAVTEDEKALMEGTEPEKSVKRERHWSMAAFVGALLAAVCLVIGGTLGGLHLLTKNTDTDKSPEAADVPDAPFKVYKDNLEIKRPNNGIADRVYFSPEHAINYSQIIVVGEYLDDPVRNYFDRSERTTADITVNDIKILEVYKGAELLDGDTLELFQYYKIENDDKNRKTTLYVSYSGYVPMYKGDKAIFMLRYHESMKSWQVANRFPLPEDKNKEDRLGFKNGITYDTLFDQALYNLLLEKYGLGTDYNPDMIPGNLNIIRNKPEVELLAPEEAVEKAQIIIIGEYLDSLENTPESLYGFKDINSTYNKIKVLDVFKGDVSVGDTVIVNQKYKFEYLGENNMENSPEKRDRLYLDTVFVPMYRGDKAIFLLTYDENSSSYKPIELFGRYPLPENKGKTDRLGFENGLIYNLTGEEQNAWFKAYNYVEKTYNIK